MLHSVQVQAILLLMLFILKNLVFCKEIKKEKKKKKAPDKKWVVNLQKQSVLKQWNKAVKQFFFLPCFVSWNTLDAKDTKDEKENSSIGHMWVYKNNNNNQV